jgi:RNA polymerase primary sigma factor
MNTARTPTKDPPFLPDAASAPATEIDRIEALREDENDDRDELNSSDRSSLTLYLKEIRGIPLLTHAQEVALSKQRQEGEARVLDHLLACPLALRHVLELGRRVESGELRVDEVVEPSMDQVLADGQASDEREKFLRRIARLRCISADGPSSPRERESAAEHAQGAIERTAIVTLLRELQLCRTQLSQIGERLKRAQSALCAAETGNAADARRRMRQIADVTGMSARQLKRCIEAICEGELQAAQAKKALTEANLRLVVKIAKRYRNSALPLQDLIQEGNLGLMRAAEKYDYRVGCRFSTYATWWIRQTMSRSLMNIGRMIRVPVQLAEARNKLYRAADTLTHSLGRTPSPEELARQSGLPLHVVETVVRLPRPPLSLSTPLAANKDKFLENYVEDWRAISPDDRALEQLACARVRKQLSVLNTRQETMLRYRFGIGMDREHTLQEIGDMFVITRERARQIEAQALRRLRAAGRTKEPSRHGKRQRATQRQSSRQNRMRVRSPAVA